MDSEAGTEDFELFEFSTKHDPVPTLLTQNHVAWVRGFLGQTTSYNRKLLKGYVIVLAEIPGSDYVKYIHAPYGQGFFSLMGIGGVLPFLLILLCPLVYVFMMHGHKGHQESDAPVDSKTEVQNVGSKS